MSHTSAPVPPRFGAMGLYWFVCESRTATLPTLLSTLPSCLTTWEMRPPNQMLVPTCSIALTRPSTIAVWSGVSDGNATTAPLARRSATAVESNNKTVLLIPSSFFSEAEENKDEAPTSYAPRSLGRLVACCPVLRTGGPGHLPWRAPRDSCPPGGSPHTRAGAPASVNATPARTLRLTRRSRRGGPASRSDRLNGG